VLADVLPGRTIATEQFKQEGSLLFSPGALMVW